MKKTVTELTTEKTFASPPRVWMTDDLSTIVSLGVVNEQLESFAFVSLYEIVKVIVLLKNGVRADDIVLVCVKTSLLGRRAWLYFDHVPDTLVCPIKGRMLDGNTE